MTANSQHKIRRIQIILFLAFAALFAFGIAFIPYWHLSIGDTLWDRLSNIPVQMNHDFSANIGLFFVTFALPATVGVLILPGTFIASYWPAKKSLFQGYLWMLICVVTTVLCVYFAYRLDLHILIISLVAIATALWYSGRRIKAASSTE